MQRELLCCLCDDEEASVLKLLPKYRNTEGMIHNTSYHSVARHTAVSLQCHGRLGIQLGSEIEFHLLYNKGYMYVKAYRLCGPILCFLKHRKFGLSRYPPPTGSCDFTAHLCTGIIHKNYKLLLVKLNGEDT